MASHTTFEVPDDFYEQAAPEVRSVDLKWAVWSMDRDYWEERAPGVWDWMRQWFDASTDPGNPEQTELAGFPRIVESAPRKEIRWAEVSIYPGHAVVSMTAEWDNGTRFLLVEQIEADTFEELMHQIDHCEVELMRENHDQKTGRCIKCGYPYQSKTARRLVPERYAVEKISPWWKEARNG